MREILVVSISFLLLTNVIAGIALADDVASVSASEESAPASSGQDASSSAATEAPMVVSGVVLGPIGVDRSATRRCAHAGYAGRDVGGGDGRGRERRGLRALGGSRDRGGGHRTAGRGSESRPALSPVSAAPRERIEPASPWTRARVFWDLGPVLQERVSALARDRFMRRTRRFGRRS